MDAKLRHHITTLSDKGKEYLFSKVKERLAERKSQQPMKLVAYIAPISKWEPRHLSDYLRTRLPDYMVPSLFVKVQEFPKLPNGKIDRNALKKIGSTTLSNESSSLHTQNELNSDTTKTLIHIWERVLNIKPVGPKDNFFELGGDSILSIQVIAEARKKNIPITPNLLFEYQTIKALTHHLETLGTNSLSTLEHKLIAIWEEVLDVKPVHKNDNFFELGGDSILSIQVIAKARKKGIQLEPDQLFEYQTIAQLAEAIPGAATPSNTLPKEQLEQDLINIWEEVLDVKPIKVQDNFFEVGGDSILSIQLIAKARKKGIQLEPNDLFEYQSIEALLPLLTNRKTGSAIHKKLSGSMALTPIQHWFFDTHKHAPEFWNQAVVLTGIQEITKEQFKENVLFLVTEHDALRLSFQKENDAWRGRIMDDTAVNWCSYIDLSSLKEEQIDITIKKHLDDYQDQMNLTKGGLFRCFYFKLSGFLKSKIVFLAHHLVVDQTSLHIICQDFLELMDGAKDQNQSAYFTKTSTIDLWNSHLKRLGKSKEILEELSFWKKQTSMPVSLPVPDNIDLPLLEKDIATIKKVLAKDDSESLLSRCNSAYTTKTEHLLITALGITIGSWSKQAYLNLGIEKHGRETAGTTLDLSRTVNWFTTFFPLKLKIDPTTLESHIETIRDQLNTVPNNGLGYGILKYLTGQSEVDTVPNFSPEVVFNYLGQQRSVLSDGHGARKEILNQSKLKHNRSERFYFFEINVAVLDGCITINWSYGTTFFEKSIVEALADEYLTNLKNIIQHCMGKDKVATAMDLQDTPLDQEDLDNLLNALD